MTKEAQFLATPEAVRLHPAAGSIEASVEISGSKSLTNRALILAALAQSTEVSEASEVHGILHCDDSHWCIGALRALGIQIDIDGTTVTVHGCGGKWPLVEAEVYTGSSGTLSRFLPPALAAGHGRFTLQASEQMSRRPVGPLLDALSALGARVEFLREAGYYPFVLHAEGLQGSEVEVPGDVSSQYLSGLLMATPLATGPVTVKLQGTLVQPAYIDLTIQLMRDFGVTVGTAATDGRMAFSVTPQPYLARTVTLEADASTAGYFFAVAALTKGRVRVTNLDSRTAQPDIKLLDVLERMGATVVRGDGWTEVEGPAKLQGGFSVSLHEFSDQALTIGALSVFADGPVTVTDVGHIRKHESDRISALHDCLTRLGIRMDEMEDGFTVYPGSVTPGRLPTFDDHRVAMSMSLIGAVVPGIELVNPGCVAKTCPDFFERWAAIGVGVEMLDG
jgi:3-phosphoshikimate 1-carboxyvinyltransferase